MAVHLRRPAAGELVAHTDRGPQYTSFRYRQRLAGFGIAASVGSVADAYENAMAESYELALVEYLGSAVRDDHIHNDQRQTN